MIDYLYYKLYQATMKGSLRDIPHFMTPVYLAGLISINLLVINGILTKINIIPFLFSNKKYAAILVILLIGIAFIYFKNDKSHAIIEKYGQESNRQRIKGNIIVSLYVALSFIMIFVVAFFKSAKQ